LHVLIWIRPAANCPPHHAASGEQDGKQDGKQDGMSADRPSQQPVFDFLENPSTHGGGKVTRIDTHAAAVFLTEKRAFKVKRAVRFPFLDFSTLEKRKAACAAEIDINRRHAPGIYRGVVAITREPDGTLSLDGKGQPVEYAVDMARFDETQTLDRLAAAGKLDESLASELGRAVARGHHDAPVSRDANFFETLVEIARQNDGELRAAKDVFTNADVDALTRDTLAALDRCRALLTGRERSGHVRRCHGDLHLGNIVLIDGQPVLFDALEFNPAFATIDTIYDLAFLLMDLIGRNLVPLANIVLNRYLDETGDDSDLDALAALPLMMSLRAAIRAKVTAARPNRDTALTQSARDYLALARRLIAPPAPRLIAVGGLSGTGKSVLARALAAYAAPLPGAVLLRSDVLRKRMFGASETQPLPPDAYKPAVTARVYETLAGKAARVLAAGHSAVADAVFARADEREALARLAPGAFHGLFLTAGLATRIARVGGRRNDASDADAAVARAQEDYALGTLNWREVDASGTPEETLQRSKAALGL
jgi:aminoglycoside phosphotransferase family enzyme/predicted kinase